MCAIYAFMRYCDDLSDEPGANRAAIEQWRAALDEALAGRFDAHPVLPAFHDTVVRYRIPPRYFHEMVDGVASDLEPRRFETFAQLYRYCYQVASPAGLTTIHILGVRIPRGAAAGREVRHCISADQYPAGRPRGCGTGAAFIFPPKTSCVLG